MAGRFGYKIQKSHPSVSQSVGGSPSDVCLPTGDRQLLRTPATSPPSCRSRGLRAVLCTRISASRLVHIVGEVALAFQHLSYDERTRDNSGKLFFDTRL